MNMLCLDHHFKFMSEIRCRSHFYILTDQLLESEKKTSGGNKWLLISSLGAMQCWCEPRDTGKPFYFCLVTAFGVDTHLPC